MTRDMNTLFDNQRRHRETVGKHPSRIHPRENPLAQQRRFYEERAAQQRRNEAWLLFQSHPLVKLMTAQFPAESTAAKEYAHYLFRKSLGEKPKVPASAKKFRGKVGLPTSIFEPADITQADNVAHVQKLVAEHGGASPDFAVSLILTLFLFLLAACSDVSGPNTTQPSNAETATVLVEEDTNPLQVPTPVQDEAAIPEENVSPELKIVSNPDTVVFYNPFVDTGEFFYLSENLTDNTKVDIYVSETPNSFTAYTTSTIIEYADQNKQIVSAIEYRGNRPNLPIVRVEYNPNSQIADSGKVIVYFPDGNGGFLATEYTFTGTQPDSKFLRRDDILAKRIAEQDRQEQKVENTEATVEAGGDNITQADAQATVETEHNFPSTRQISLDQGRELFPVPDKNNFFAAFRYPGVGEGLAQTGQMPTEYYFLGENGLGVSNISNPVFTFENIMYDDQGNIICADLRMNWVDSDNGGKSFELVWTPESGWGTVQFEGENSKMIQTLSTIDPNNPIFYVEGNPQLMKDLGLNDIWNPNAQWWYEDTYNTHALTRAKSEIITIQEDGSSILDAQFLVFMSTMVYEKIDVTTQEVQDLRDAIDSYNLAENSQQKQQAEIFEANGKNINLTKFTFGGQKIDLTKKNKVILGGKPGGHSLLPDEPFVVEQDGSITIYMLAPEKVAAFGQAMIAVFSQVIHNNLGVQPDIQDTVPIYRVFGDHSMGWITEENGQIGVVFPILPNQA